MSLIDPAVGGPSGTAPRRYRPIDEYGVIGDLRSAALVSRDGAIDWCCLPHFDSPSVFAALLDADRGGSFRIHVPDARAARQMYVPDTNILVTHFEGHDRVGEVVDFMPLGLESQRSPHRQSLVRRVRAIRGPVRFELACRPALDYARARHDLSLEQSGAVFRSDALGLGLTSPLAPEADNHGGVRASFVLEAGERADFVLRARSPHEDPCELLAALDCEAAQADTTAFWRGWIARSRYRGRWREMVNRSALALKLLNFEPSGAMVAAVTTSLPEVIGGDRNWDYRYTWVRDASWTLGAFLELGYTREATRFMDWLFDRAMQRSGSVGPLNVMYRLDGSEEAPEQKLDHLEGYRGSSPVRIGNAAAGQFQLDIFGELISAACRYDEAAEALGFEHWRQLSRMGDFVVEHWLDRDASVWELRGNEEQFVFSKLQGWLALERLVRLADRRALPIDRERIVQVRDAIQQAILERGWHAGRGAFVQHFDTDALDASSLMMPLVGFISPADPRMRRTIDAIRRELTLDHLVYRYETGTGAGGGRPVHEGTFSIATFWLVEALARAGQVDDARFIFEKMLGYENPLGLYSEELDPAGQMVGNYPQALTHLGLINAAWELDRAIERQQSGRG